jgi:hypothetical protein
LLTTIDADTSAIAAAVKAEDSAAQSGDSGIPMLAIRQNSQADLAADGDYMVPTIDDAGGLRVSIVAGAGSGGTATADDADFTAGTTQGTIVQGVYESSPSSVTDGDVGAVGITQTRAMKVAIDSGGVTGRAEDSAHSSGHEGVVVLAVRRDTAAVGSDTDGDYSTINVDASGRVHVNVGALPASTNTIEIVGDVAQDAAVAGNPVLVGGRASTATPTAMSADGDSVYQWLTRTGATVVSGDLVDDAAFTPGTSRVQAIGLQADEAATDSVDEGDIGAPRMTLDRKQIVTAYVHAAAGGCTPYKNLDVDETEDDIKTSAGKLFWLHVMNLHASSARYLKIYDNVAASVTVGTTTPVLTYPIPPNTMGFTIGFGPQGTQFTTGICIAATTGLADNDTGAPGANEVVVNAGYI